MVLILGSGSEIGAQVWSDLGFLKVCLDQEQSRIPVFFLTGTQSIFSYHAYINTMLREKQQNYSQLYVYF